VTGATPQLTVGTVSNLASGNNPTVSISGTTLNPVLNFGLVQGIPGTNGTQGPKGDTGPQGPKGDNGSDASSASGDAALAYCVGISPAPNPILAVYVSPVGVTFSGLNNCVDAIGTVLDIAVGDIAAINTTLDDVVIPDINTINDEIDALQGKTQYMTCNTETITTSFASKLTTTGDISTTGNLSATGYVNGLNILGDATSTTLSSNTATSTTILGNNIYLGSFASQVYINNVPLTPFSSASSFFNQW